MKHCFFRTGPFSKSATPEVKSLAGSFVTSPLLLNGFSASENPLYPEPIRTEQGRQEGRKKGGRETERNTCLQGWCERAREDGGSGCTGSRYGIEWRGCKGSLAWKNSSSLRRSVDAIRRCDARATAQDRTSKSDFYLTSIEQQKSAK